MSRGLLSTIRHVPAHRRGTHARLWEGVQRAVAAAGGNAWAFQRADSPERVVEFIEGMPIAPILANEAVADARARLDEAVPAERTEEWSSMEDA